MRKVVMLRCRHNDGSRNLVLSLRGGPASNFFEHCLSILDFALLLCIVQVADMCLRQKSQFEHGLTLPGGDSSLVYVLRRGSSTSSTYVVGAHAVGHRWHGALFKVKFPEQG